MQPLLCSVPVFFMARIATCTCGFEFYDSTETRTTCNRCTVYKAKKAAKMASVQAFYANLKQRGKFNLNWAVIQCLSREGLSIAETAKVLGFSYDEIRFEWDIARQNSR